MKQPTLTILSILFSLCLFSQSPFNSSDLNVTKGDLETKIYPQDTTANALMIYEHGKSFVNKSTYLLNTEITKKLKILNKEGFDKATITIPLYNNKSKKEDVKNIQATVYNIENGKVTKVKLKKSGIFNETYSENTTLVKFTFPNIKEGSVITYSYTITSPFMFNYKSWEFQGDIPKLYSEYETSIPGNWQYNIKLVGTQKLVKNDSHIESNCLSGPGGAYSGCAISTYAMENIPAFVEEDYMTTKENYLARIDYELKTFQGFDGVINNYTKSWKTVDHELKTDKDIGRQFLKNTGLDDEMASLLANVNSPLDKAQLIYKYVQDNYRWNGEYHLFKDVSVKDLTKEKTGSVSEINILLHNLLNEQGVEAKPVLLSTRNNGFATKLYPVLSEFNYLIVQVNIGSERFLLDATDDFLDFGEVPFKCLNKDGRLIDFKKGSEWIEIAPRKNSIIVQSLNLQLDTDNVLSGNINLRSTGYHAISDKKKFYSNKEDYFDSYFRTFEDIEILNHEVETKNKSDYEFLENLEISYPLSQTGDKLYIDPFLIKFFSQNPFKLQERNYPIDFGFKDSFLYKLQINVSDDLNIVEIPKDFKVSLPNNTGSLIFSSKKEDNNILLYLKFDFKESLYGPEYYKSLKIFFGKIVDIQHNSLIVLEKKS
ncbi:DUF3857 domain-containing protein [Mangrovimonas sp. YM274]|uniref:DUF3857 domain-containing protein n=1 Tax=Mangrovimonas sp. YM274 TaxID=3070660 RepID=UPI0027DD2ED3|nr:DUF3857 domain-containing protein [Mangrovimonas sp. YM274]WMI67592.1 DUF3857 domain-containing protein [Mangrovimonas sp. YM274]